MKEEEHRSYLFTFFDDWLIFLFAGLPHDNPIGEQSKLKAQAYQADLYKLRRVDIRLSLDEKDDTIERMQEQLHRIYKEFYEAEG